jgi:hypothetical protein
LNFRIEERISKRLSSDELREFDSISGSAAEWLETHVPEYREIVKEEQRIINEFIK